MDKQTKKIINKCLQEIKKRNNKYIDILYYLIAHRLRYIALKYLRNEEDAFDVVQDFWADIYENAKNFTYEDNGFSYLCRIMTCMSINRFNKIHGEKQKAVEFTEISQIILFDELALVENLDYKIVVKKAMLNLDPVEQAVMQLIIYEDKTIMQIAKILNMSKSKVGRIKLAAEEKLKNELSEFKWEKSEG